MRRILCLFGWHKRSRSRAWRDGAGVAHSECRACQRAMRKDEATGLWALRGSGAPPVVG